MKLTKSKLIETIRALNDGDSKHSARKIAGITKQRLYQVWNLYQKSGKLPEIGRRVGRPTKPITDEERELVKDSWTKYRVPADALELLLMRDKKVKIGHNRIHKILLELGFAKKKAKKDVRKKKWIRYERRHSLTAVHIDWHQRPNDGIWVFAVIDDASRKELALIECQSPTTEESIHGMRMASANGTILQCISDHGAQFVSNNGGDSRFLEYLAKHNIQQILCRIKHPQSNGKAEKWFDTYERHRDGFQSVEAFLHWYNDVRPHRSLNWSILETPSQAFERKKKVGG